MQPDSDSKFLLVSECQAENDAFKLNPDILLYSMFHEQLWPSLRVYGLTSCGEKVAAAAV